MVRVLHICTEDIDKPLGGMGMHCQKLLPELNKIIEADIVTMATAFTPSIIPKPDQCIEAAYSNIREMSLQAFEKHYAREYDIVHFHDWTGAQTAFDMQNAFGLPVISTWHLFQTQIAQVENLPNDWRVQNAMQHEIAGWFISNRVIVCSKDMQQRGQMYYGPQNISVIPNGVDVDEWQIGSTSISGRPKVLFCGRWTVQKGVDAIMDAIELTDDFEFNIVGPWQENDWPQSNRLQELAAKYPDRVKLHGVKQGDERKPYYAEADYFLMPSLAEPFGIAALEAMAAGVPLITTAVDGLGEFCDASNSIICEPTGESIVEALNRPYSLSIVSEAFDMANRFDWSEIAKQTVKIYEELLDDSADESRWEHAYQN